MKTAVKDTIKTITTHYIDGAFVESHGREVNDGYAVLKEGSLNRVVVKIPIGELL